MSKVQIIGDKLTQCRVFFLFSVRFVMVVQFLELLEYVPEVRRPISKSHGRLLIEGL